MRTIGTITLGTHKTRRACLASLQKNDIKVIRPWTEEILKKILFTQTPIELELIEVSVKELGFDEATRLDVICRRIVERGFDLCPGEAGPVFREFYKHQPKGERIILVTEAISISDDGPCIFRVGHGEDGLWLRADYGFYRDRYSLGYRFVVARRKQT